MEILHKEFTRRDLIKLAASGMTGAALTALEGRAALSAAPAPGAKTAEAIKRGGTLRVVVQTDFQTMWPPMGSNASPWDCFDPLFKWRQDEKGKWTAKYPRKNNSRGFGATLTRDRR